MQSSTSGMCAFVCDLLIRLSLFVDYDAAKFEACVLNKFFMEKLSFDCLKVLSVYRNHKNF